MTETSGSIAWAVALLKADAEITALVSGRVHESLAPPKTPYPFILISRMFARQIGTSSDGTKGASRIRLYVRAVTEASGFTTAEAILSRIVAVLHKATGSVNDVSISSCIDVGSRSYVEVQNGVRYNHHGSYFDLVVMPT